MEEIRLSRILNREILLLIGLAVLAFIVFGLTRRLAAKEQQLEGKVAAVWFERGQQAMAAGKTEDAIQSFRKAAAGVGDNRKYGLALASALAAANDNGEARTLLLQLRDSDPQDPEINIALARLEAKAGSVPEAVHYYQNAIYGRWPADAVDQRRQLRFELVHLLLHSQQNNLAFSELLILQGTTPDSAPDHVALAKLFTQAGDSQRALQEYQAAVRLDENNAEALAGAGITAFHVGDYAQAERFLKLATEADPNSTETQQLLKLATSVQANDPLSPNLNPGERQRRLSIDLDTSLQRLDACLETIPTGSGPAELQSLKTNAEALRKQFRGSSKPPDSDAIRSGIGLIFQMEQAASQFCGAPQPDDQALLLMGREYNGGHR